MRAIFIGKAYVDEENYDEMRDSRNNLQTRKAYEIALKLNLNVNEPWGLNEIKKIEMFLENYQIIVLNGDNANEFDYVGPEKDKKIVLYLKDFVSNVCMFILFLKITLVTMFVKSVRTKHVIEKIMSL